MKTAFRLLLFFAFQTALFAADTAYTALRVFGKQNGVAALNHVVEVRGRAGVPAPSLWKITLEDKSARGGLHELEFQHGKVVAERNPVSRSTGPAMNFSQLNLDSDGVFTIADQEAKKAGVSFDHVDYTLHSGAEGAAPVWQLELFDNQAGRVADIDIAADSGNILRKDFTVSHTAPPPPPPLTATTPPPPYVAPPTVHHAPPAPDDDPLADDEPPSGDQPTGIPHFVEKIRHHFEKRSRQFENFFTGKGWTQEP